MDPSGETDLNGGLPWASAFDSGANVRALTAIQAEGFRAASELVERFIKIASAGLASTGLSGTGPSAPEPLSEDVRADVFGATAVEPLMRSWWSMVGQFVGGPAAGGEHAQHEATLDFAELGADGRLSLEVAAPGSAIAELWLHNSALNDLGQIHLRCSELLSDQGTVIQSSAVVIEPSVVPMPGRSSRGLDVTVEVGDSVPPGVYRGTVLAEGYPDLWLPVAVRVRSRTT